MDAAFAFAGLIILSPILFLVGLAVKLTTHGPVFFRQKRTGQFEKPFLIFKFRSMVAGDASNGSLLTAAGDTRITAVGAWLRKTKIDELPQLINVVLGDMSLVGPRPEVPKYTAGYTDKQKRVFLAKPGITCTSIDAYEEELLAQQVDKEAFYLSTILPAKLEVHLAYTENISFWDDMKIVFSTFAKIFGRLCLLLQAQFGILQTASENNPIPNTLFQSDRDRETSPPMKKKFDLYSRMNQMILDGCSFALSLAVACLLSFEGRPFGSNLLTILLWLPILISLRLAVHWVRGIYRQIWRFVSFSDALEIAQSIGIVSVALAGLHLLYPEHAAFSEWVRIPFSVIALEGLSSLTFSMAIRAFRRTLYVNQRRAVAVYNQSSRRILLYGAGRAGIMLRRELEASHLYDVLGFIDDDPQKVGSMVEHTLVLGSGSDLERLTSRYRIDEVLICMATASRDTVKLVVGRCRQAEVAARVIPSVRELLVSQSTNVQSPDVNAADGSDKQGVLVIGGAGYIGSTLVRQLLERNYRVRVLDSLLYGDGGIQELLGHADFELIKGDSRDVESVVRSYRDIGAVIHLGAIVGDAACALEPSRTVEINLAATKMIADVCKGYGVSRFLFASTCSVYGASDYLLDEESRTNPISLYASTKLDSEGIILDAASPGFHPTILRLATAFGASYRLRFDLVVNLLSIKALMEKRIALHGGSQWRPFIHVHDIARCFILAMESQPELVSKQIFNAGSDDLNFTITQLGNRICEYVPGVKIDTMPETDKRNYRVSFAKVRERLGFICEKSIEDAVIEFKHLCEAGLIEDYRDSQYSNHDFLKAQPTDEIARTLNFNLPLAATLKSLSQIGALSKF